MSEAPHLDITFYLHAHMIWNNNTAYSASLHLQWTPRKTQN